MHDRRRLVIAALIAGFFAAAGSAGAQPISNQNYGGPHGAFSNFEQMEQAGPGRKGKNDADILKEAKTRITDADPRVRTEGIEKLRYVGDSAAANELLFRGLNDTDVRVRIKAIDVLGARASHDAVAAMSQDLFLRETPAVEKLHLVAALGRIGDTRGSLPVMEYLDQTDDMASRGTAVFALGEIGDPRSNDKLIETVKNDPAPMVRKLAEEAIEKIDGEIPNRHQAEEAKEKSKGIEPTDAKLAKLREYDAEAQAEKSGRGRK